MELFKNTQRLDYAYFFKQQFKVIVTAILITLIFVSIEGLESGGRYLLIFLVLAEIPEVLKLVYFFSKKRLNRVSWDKNTRQLKVFQSRLNMESVPSHLNIEELEISDLNYFPARWLNFGVFFNLKDHKTKLKLTSTDFGVNENDVRTIYNALVELKSNIQVTN